MPEEPSHPEVRAAITRLCADYPNDYWRDKDRDKSYPAEFVQVPKRVTCRF